MADSISAVAAKNVAGIATDRGDPLRAAAAAQILLSNALGDTVQILAAISEDKKNALSTLNDLRKNLQQWRPTDLNGSAALGGSDLSNQAQLDEANRIMDALHAQGVALDQPPGYDKDPSVKFQLGQDRSFRQEVYDKWDSQLQKQSDNVQLETQQLTVKLQNTTSYFTKANETATSLIAKYYQTAEAASRNFAS